MADLVRFESSRDVLAVRPGGVIDLEPGGQINAGVTPLIPPPRGTTDGKVLTAKASAAGGADWEAGGGGGSSTLAALTDVQETSPADGDLLSYDAGSGKWVNSGNLKIGASFSFGGLPTSDPGVANILPLALDATSYLFGLTVDGTLHTLTFPTKGRYLLSLKMIVAVAASYPHRWTLQDDTTNASISQIVLSDTLMGGIGTTSNNAIILDAQEIVEIAAATTIQWNWMWFDLGGLGPDTPSPEDVELRIQYLGPATSL